MISNEQNEILEKVIGTTLDSLIHSVNNFIRKMDSFSQYNSTINRIISAHPIFKKRDRLQKIIDIINNSKEITNKNIIEIKEKSIMRTKRKKELKRIKHLVKKKKSLMLGELTESKKLLLLQSCENDINLSKEISSSGKIGEGNVEKQLVFTTCYICKKKLYSNNIHKFYGSLCNKCGEYNYSFRTLKLDLTGRIAIVTGGRIKIGYYIGTKLLSYGCKVLITSRFPKDALLKYQQDPDYEKWKDNLIIYPIDFRIFESVVKFINYIKDNFPHIDILINNAAQTVRKTSAYYRYLLPIESKKLNEEDEKKIINIEYLGIQNMLSPEKQSTTINPLVETKKYNEALPLSFIASQIKIMEEKTQPIVSEMGDDGQPYDFSKGKNSWNFEYDEIPFQEFTEVQIINAWIPYYLCVKLKPLMEKSPFQDKYIVNVTAVEGIFNHYKRTTHVHTNMAKAALNMFTRTCGKYLKNFNIYMTCVDTGWVSHMSEMNNILNDDKKEDYENLFENIPLDELDGAMRVLHPIIEGVQNKNYLYGILLKDYVKCDW
jgi:NAD(P)-dependent dehydrogenase (short-subunit alcohol dehydrogenase family)